MAFADIIRSGNEQELLLSDWPVWKRYRDQRSKTGHAYDEAMALDVMETIPTFLRDAIYLRDQLEARQR